MEQMNRLFMFCIYFAKYILILRVLCDFIFPKESSWNEKFIRVRITEGAQNLKQNKINKTKQNKQKQERKKRQLHNKAWQLSGAFL